MGAEWGTQAVKGKHESHIILAKAQRVFGDRVLEDVRNTKDTFSWKRPTRWARELMMTGFSDMFYYVSTEGKWAIRNTVAAQLSNHLNDTLPDGQAASLTLIGHSAGSVIAFDLLYYMFMNSEMFNELSWLTERGRSVEKPGIAGAAESTDEIIKQRKDRISAEAKTLRENFNYLQNLVSENRLRIRLFVTLGSPISMMMYRSDRLVELFASENGQLTPEEYGLTHDFSYEPLKPHQPRWINIWDVDDLVSWPVSRVMGNSPLVKDIYPDFSDSIIDSHNLYWESEAVQKAIAEHWLALKNNPNQKLF